MCSLDLDEAQVWRETTRKARKEHECDGCGQPIAAGELYVDHFHLFDGEATSEKCCAVCHLIRTDFVEAHGQGMAPSYIYEALQDCIGENDDDEDGWRQLFAVVKRRYRTSRAGRSQRAREAGYRQTSRLERAEWLASRNTFKPIPFSWPGGAE